VSSPKGNPAQLMELSMAKDAIWSTIDPETLPTHVQSLYLDYKQAYQVAKANRKQFEAAMSTAASLPAGQRMVFGYNFGKLSVAIVKDDRPQAKPARKAQSLSEYLAAQR